MVLENIKQKFLNFAATECKDHSALYYKLSQEIAADTELLKMASYTRNGQPVPNIFLAAVHYLLLKNSGSELADFFPSIQKKLVSVIPFSLFKKFCIQNEKEIRDIISTRIVQTNVINRCAYLMPVISKILFDEGKPATIIDIGTSAGLTLNFDKYEYWYNGGKVYGDSKVIVNSNIIDSSIPDIFPISQSITKIGIDQNIIDPSDADEILWLKALIWPDQVERFVAMEEALKLDELKNISFVQAQKIEDFRKVLLAVPANEILIVYATHVLYQFSQELLEDFYLMLEAVAQKRDLYFLSVEGIQSLLKRYNSKDVVAELYQFKNGQKNIILLAETNGHGKWIKWK